MELALISDPLGGPSYWAILADGKELFTAQDYFDAQDKYDQILSEQQERENN